MKATRFGLVVFIALIALIAIMWYLVTYLTAHQSAPEQLQPVAEVVYQCNNNKTIDASYYDGPTKPSTSPDQPPMPGGKVTLKLSDGRAMTLPQTISADGARYSNGNPNVAGSETFVFWSKGNGALVLENNQQKSYIGCIQMAKDPGSLPNAYESGSRGFSIRYPAGYTVDEDYAYQELGPQKEIGGVKFTVASSTVSGTNLGSDTYLSVEEIPQVQQCSADLFLDPQSHAATSTVTDNGIDYSFASSTGAGAGNRYEEDVYALSGTNPCMAVRYFIHWGVYENYPAGSVQQFDMQALKQQFDAIRRTLTISQ